MAYLRGKLTYFEGFEGVWWLVVIKHLKVYIGYMRKYLMKELKKGFKTLCDECGAIVKGTSEIHLKANMMLHKRGKNHKEIMELKESMLLFQNVQI